MASYPRLRAQGNVILGLPLACGSLLGNALNFSVLCSAAFNARKCFGNLKCCGGRIMVKSCWDLAILFLRGLISPLMWIIIILFVL